MSYCRWSSDDFRCDVYCYEDVGGGYVTHVASNRVVGDIPPSGDPRQDTFFEEHQKQMAFLDKAERVPIGLAHDGESYNDTTLTEFRQRLVMLREAGYNIPSHVFESIDEEMMERNNELRIVRSKT